MTLEEMEAEWVERPPEVPHTKAKRYFSPHAYGGGKVKCAVPECNYHPQNSCWLNEQGLCSQCASDAKQDLLNSVECRDCPWIPLSVSYLDENGRCYSCALKYVRKHNEMVTTFDDEYKTCTRCKLDFWNMGADGVCNQCKALEQIRDKPSHVPAMGVSGKFWCYKCNLYKSNIGGNPCFDCVTPIMTTYRTNKNRVEVIDSKPIEVISKYEGRPDGRLGACEDC